MRRVGLFSLPNTWLNTGRLIYADSSQAATPRMTTRQNDLSHHIKLDLGCLRAMNEDTIFPIKSCMNLCLCEHTIRAYSHSRQRLLHNWMGDIATELANKHCGERRSGSDMHLENQLSVSRAKP